MVLNPHVVLGSRESQGYMYWCITPNEVYD